MKKSVCCLVIFACITSNAQKTDKELQNQIEVLVKGFHGTAGIYVHDLKKNRIAEYNADTVFPTASIVKIPIMIGIMDRIFRNELGYHQVMIYKDTLNYDPGEDVLASFKPDEKILLSKLLLLSLSLSDNTASLMLQGMSGGQRINKLMDSLGYRYTRVNSRTPGREKEREIYGWGQTTPREIARLMEQIETEKLLSQPISDRMLRMLGRQYWDEVALSQIPPNVFVATKSGAVDETKHGCSPGNYLRSCLNIIIPIVNGNLKWLAGKKEKTPFGSQIVIALSRAITFQDPVIRLFSTT
jgi:beta-lactamase class A